MGAQSGVRGSCPLTLALSPRGRGDARHRSCPSPLGEREGPIAKRREGEGAWRLGAKMSTPAAEQTLAVVRQQSAWTEVRFLLRRYPLGAAGAVIMALFVFAAIFAGAITQWDPLSTNAALSLARPSATHWLGADFLGRDVYSRIVYGARISLIVGLGS